MNELTIGQLKALPVGNWVWVVDNSDNDETGYYIITPTFREDLLELATRGHGTAYKYLDYGKTWKAYRNKQEAEAKGDLYKTAFELILQDVYDNRLKADTLSCSSCPFMFELFDGCENQGLYEDCKRRWQNYYLAEAERRLAELTKESFE